VDTFAARHPKVDLSDLRNMAVEALQKVLNDGSELKELWAESEDYPIWKQSVDQLARQLQ
jgi:hypothetical protein